MIIQGAKPFPFPPADMPCLHVMSDPHFLTGGEYGSTSRFAKVIWDLQRGEVPVCTHRVCSGDMADDGSSGADAAAQAAFAQISGTILPCIGNHDVNMNANNRTPAQWATAWGITPTGPDACYTYDLPWGVRLIFLSFASMADTSTIRLSDATMTWLDSTLTAAASKRCYIVCHAPLYNTVLPGSTTAMFWAVGGTSTPNDTADGSNTILTLLASHSNVAAWISGHTHSPIESSGMVTTVTAGSKIIAHINVSSLSYTSATQTDRYIDRQVSSFITDYGDHIEVRHRDHMARGWAVPFGNPGAGVMTAAGLTAA